MKRIAIGVAILLTAAACGGGLGAGDRTVLVDYSHDEFASFFIGNFPKEVTVAAGGAVVFKQTWTGEPHTVTGGTTVNAMMGKAQNWIGLFGSFDPLASKIAGFPNPEREPEVPFADLLHAVEGSDAEPFRTQFLESYDALVEQGSALPPRDKPGTMTLGEAGGIIDKESEAVLEGSGLPWALDEYESETGAFVTQNAGQPCYLDKGAPPKDSGIPCSKKDQEQPVFNGKQSYYNSGIIPYEGPQGNKFRVDIAPDTKPGSYFFYCAVHGPSQATEVNVRPKGTGVPTQQEVTQQAQKEIREFAKPMLSLYKDALDGTIEVQGKQIRGPFAGLAAEVHGSINEFIPRRINATVGEKVTWKLMGSEHTVSFDVPEYFPIITFANSGRVAINPKLQKPAGGSPPIPEQEGRGLASIDGGTYDGEGFFSSGLYGAEPYAEYNLRFSEPGTYKYACLLHPPMVGTVEVT